MRAADSGHFDEVHIVGHENHRAGALDTLGDPNLGYAATGL